MYTKLWCAVATFVLLVAAGVVTVAGGGVPSAATACQRIVAIDAQVTSPESGGTLTFAVHSRGCPAAGHVSFTVTGATASQPGDYAVTNGQIQWSGGDSSSKAITVAISNDALPEALLEDFSVKLADASRAITVAAAAGQGRILDDDSSVLALVVDDRSCPSAGTLAVPQVLPSLPLSSPCTLEGGNIGMAIWVWRNKPQQLSVNVRTVNGSLLGGRDYRAIDQTITFASGQAGARVDLEVFGHVPAGYLTIQLSSASAGVIADHQATAAVLQFA